MIRTFRLLFVFFLVIASTRFFGANFLNQSLVNYSQFCLAFLGILLSLPYFFSKQVGFVLPVQMLSISIAISVIMAYVSWEQSFKDTLLVTVPLLLWPLFFYLIAIDFSIKKLEKIVIIYGLLYIIVYLFQYTHPDMMLFGKPNWGEEFQEDRGVIRIVPPGGGLLFFSAFIALNKITAERKGKWIWILLLIFGILVPVLQVTRVSIFGVAVIYFIHFIKGHNISKKILTILSVILVASYISLIYTEIKPLKGMVDAQKQTAQEGEKYIRVLAGSYFLNEFSPSAINRVMGNGVPYVDFTYYGRFVYNLNEKYGYYLEDLGILSVYVMYGIVAVVAYIIIWIKSFKFALPKEYQYLKYNLWFLFINGFTTVDLYFADHLIGTVLTVYAYHNIVSKEKQKNAGYNPAKFLNYAPYNFRKMDFQS